MEPVVHSRTKQPRTEECARIHTHNGGLHFFTTENLYVESLLCFSVSRIGEVMACGDHGCCRRGPL